MTIWSSRSHYFTLLHNLFFIFHWLSIFDPLLIFYSLPIHICCYVTLLFYWYTYYFLLIFDALRLSSTLILFCFILLFAVLWLCSSIAAYLLFGEYLILYFCRYFHLLFVVLWLYYSTAIPNTFCCNLMSYGWYVIRWKDHFVAGLKFYWMLFYQTRKYGIICK